MCAAFARVEDCAFAYACPGGGAIVAALAGWALARSACFAVIAAAACAYGDECAAR